MVAVFSLINGSLMAKLGYYFPWYLLGGGTTVIGAALMCKSSNLFIYHLFNQTTPTTPSNQPPPKNHKIKTFLTPFTKIPSHRIPPPPPSTATLSSSASAPVPSSKRVSASRRPSWRPKRSLMQWGLSALVSFPFHFSRPHLPAPSKKSSPSPSPPFPPPPQKKKERKTHPSHTGQSIGIVISLAIAGSIYQNEAYTAIKPLLPPSIPAPEIRSAIAGTSSAVLRDLPQGIREMVIEAVVRTMDRVYILAIAGGALTVLLGVVMPVSFFFFFFFFFLCFFGSQCVC